MKPRHFTPFKNNTTPWCFEPPDLHHSKDNMTVTGGVDFLSLIQVSDVVAIFQNTMNCRRARRTHY